MGREIKNNLKKSGTALWNFSLSLKALPLSEHLAKLFSLSRRCRFRNMIDDAIMIASGHQLLGIGQCRHIELPVAVIAPAFDGGVGDDTADVAADGNDARPDQRRYADLAVAVVALAAQAGNIAIQRVTVRLAGSDLLNRRHRNAAGK
ncbi:MAG: hypothetical protein ABSF79_02760 [Smithellaceae bacterium]|jgi:hypothetical protein